MPGETSLLLTIALPFVGSLLATLLPANARNAEAWLAGTFALVVLIVVSAAYPGVTEGGVLRTTIEWVPQIGLNLSLRMDGFAWMFAMLISGIGFLVVLYARYYMSPKDPIRRFYSLFLAFMGAMLGIVLSGNLLLMVVFWELTSIVSFLLIGYWYHNQAARDGARMALTITAIGGLALLGGVLIIGHIVGSYDLDRVLAAGREIRTHALYIPAIVLVLAGALTKSAQFPFHFWLPSAMAAPTPVSAYLHSATMVKAGVFLIARLWPSLSGTYEWFLIVGTAGTITLVLGSYFAIYQQDIKGLLAYSTISHLGLITLLLGLGSPLGVVAAIFHMMNHATFKASLFMAAGVIDHETGTRDIRRLSGLFRYMPFTATLAMVSSAAMAGVPLLNGFLSKEMFFAEAIEHHENSVLDSIAPYVAVLAGAFAVTYSLRFIHGVFFGPPPTDLPREPHEPPFWMRFPILLLVTACLIVGIVPGRTIGPYLHTAVSSVLGQEMPYYSLAVWHGFNLPLIMSAIALVAGVILYFKLKGFLGEFPDGPPLFSAIKGPRVFERVLTTVAWKWPVFVESHLGTRQLQPQLAFVVLVAVIAAAWPLYAMGLDPGRLTWAGLDPAFAAVWIVGIACAVGAAQQARLHRFAALVLLGGAGLAACITFVWFSAPDLALTQLLVEIVTTVLILLGLRWLPKRSDAAVAVMATSAKQRRVRDFGLAFCVGAGMTLISYAVMMRAPPDTIADYFLERAYPEGGGRNVVNVILVDFRAFDTLGEITVLGIVALTVFALLRRFRPASDNVEAPKQQLIQAANEETRPERNLGDTLHDYLLVPSVIMTWLFPVTIVLAAYLFLRGHDLPGGGFAAGVAMAAAFILQYMALGTRTVEDRLTVLPVNWIAIGLLISFGVGAGSWLFGYPFLTSYSRYIDIPLIGLVPGATALVFDAGVFALVLGATVLILIALAHQSIRRHRARTLASAMKEETV